VDYSFNLPNDSRWVCVAAGNLGNHHKRPIVVGPARCANQQMIVYHKTRVFWLTTSRSFYINR